MRARIVSVRCERRSVRLFLGGVTLDHTIAQLVLEVAGVLDVAPEPERNSLGLAGRERLRLSVEVGAQRGVDRRGQVGAARRSGAGRGRSR